MNQKIVHMLVASAFVSSVVWALPSKTVPLPTKCKPTTTTVTVTSGKDGKPMKGTHTVQCPVAGKPAMYKVTCSDASGAVYSESGTCAAGAAWGKANCAGHYAMDCEE